MKNKDKEGISKSLKEWKNSDGIIVPPKEAFPINEGEGLWKKLDREYRADSNFDLATFKEELYKFFDNPEISKDFEKEQKFMESIKPYLKMTKEEMEVAIPHGMYDIGGSTMCAWTGKGGLIEVILNIQKALKYDKI